MSKWDIVYKDGSDDEDPFPKMLTEEDESLLGPFVSTEVITVRKVLPCNALILHVSLVHRWPVELE